MLEKLKCSTNALLVVKMPVADAKEPPRSEDYCMWSL
jgi:hypothetical protein